MSRPLRIVIGSDDAGYEYKEAIKQEFIGKVRVAEVIDIGVGEDGHTPYPLIAATAGEMIVADRADRGLLVCGTGLGMAIAANKVPGIRSATAHDSFSVERSVLSNNAQILTFGQRVIGLELAKRLAGEWLAYEFDERSPSALKVALVSDYERGHNSDV